MHLEVTHELGQGRCCLHYSLWVCGAGGVGWVSSHLPVCLSMLDFLLPAITVSSCDRGLGSYLSGTHIVTNLSLSSKFVTHIWSGIPSSLLKVWPIKPRINHFSWSCRTSDSQGQSSPTLDMAQSQVSETGRDLVSKPRLHHMYLEGPEGSGADLHRAELSVPCSYPQELDQPDQGSQSPSPSPG